MATSVRPWRIYVTTVLNPLNCLHIGGVINYWFLLGTRNWIHYRTFLMELQKAASLEDPGSFREEKREGRNRLSKNLQFGKFQEDSGKVSGKRCEHCSGCGFWHLCKIPFTSHLTPSPPVCVSKATLHIFELSVPPPPSVSVRSR